MASSSKSMFLVWVQIIVASIIVAWLSYDFFHSIFNGMTYTIRLDDRLHFSNNKLPFIIAVVIKLAVYYFFITLLGDCFKALKKNGESK